MFDGKKVTVVLPAFNESENIGHAIEEFKKQKSVDEIIVIDNNSTDNTPEIAKKKNAIVIRETKQGYGNALRRGLREAKGDYIVLSEPDGTFSADDLSRLLNPIKNYDMVAGTRTNKKYIEKGANMGPFLRFGNLFVAKLIQLLYRTNNLTDCGCSFRVLKKSLVKNLENQLTVGGSHFLSEIVVLTALNNGKILEIPVVYKKRVGTSKITGSFKRAIIVGFKMVNLIIKYRIKGKN